MKKFLVLLTTSLFLLTGISAITNATEETKPAAPAAPGLKIGVFDWQLLLQKAPQAEEAAKRLEKEFHPRKENLIAKQKELQAKQEKMNRDKDVMSEAERAKIEKDLAKLQQDFRRTEEDLRSEYTIRHREEMEAFMQIVKEVVDKFSKEEKYDVIFTQEVAAFAGEKVDITPQVLQRLTKYKPSKEKKS